LQAILKPAELIRLALHFLVRSKIDNRPNADSAKDGARFVVESMRSRRLEVALASERAACPWPDSRRGLAL
jgi:hypothetical protein